MNFERHKIGSIVAGLVMFVLLVAATILFTLPTYRKAMYQPTDGHRKTAIKALESIIGADSERISLPAVHNDISLIYVTADLSEASIDRVKAQGGVRRDLPGEVYEFQQRTNVVLIDLATKPSKIMIGPPGDTNNARLCVASYRAWLDGDKPPSP